MPSPFKFIRRLILGSVFALPLLCAAQQTVRIVVPFAAGSSTDPLARQVAETLREINGHNYLIDNKPGASAVIGTAEVAKAKPDGNALLMTTGGHATNAVLYEKLPFDPLRDFTSISQLTQSAGFLLMVPPTSPYKTLEQLLAAARANPGKLTYGSAGIDNTTHLAGALFERAAGIKLVHVPYKGTPMNDLMAGHIDMLFWGVGFAAPIVKGGKAGAIALAGDKRTRRCPTCRRSSRRASPEWTYLRGRPCSRQPVCLRSWRARSRLMSMQP